MIVKTRLAMALAVALFAATAATGTPPAPPLKGFVSDKTIDYFGYYMPTKPLKIGKWNLRNISFDTLEGFKTFEAGKDPKEFAAMLLEFEDVTSPKKAGEDSIEYYTRSIRVLPTAYRVLGNKVSFIGTDKTLGTVAFEGTFDPKFLKRTANDVGPADGSASVLHGTLTFGGKTYPGDYYWFGGD